MRALVLAAAGLLVSLSGCDQVPAPTQQQAQIAAPVAPPCNCQPPAEHLARLDYAPVRHTRHRHYDGGYHGSYTSQSENSVDAYGYVSASSVSYSESSSDSSDSTGGYEGGGYDAEGHRYYRGRIAWVDGYGRGYFNDGPVTVAQTMNGKRMHVWHGYDADCPDDRR